MREWERIRENKRMNEKIRENERIKCAPWNVLYMIELFVFDPPNPLKIEMTEEKI